MKDPYMHLVNIHVAFAEKELVWTQCIVAFAVCGCTKDAADWREKNWVIYPIFKCNKYLQPPERNYIHKIKLGKV